MQGFLTMSALAFMQLVVVGCSPNPQRSAGLTISGARVTSRTCVAPGG